MSNHIRTSKRRQGVRLTKEERVKAQEQFLNAYRSSGNIRASCMAAGIDRQTVRQWEEHDEEFSLLYHEAEKEVDDLIDAELFRRALHGDKEPIVSMGKVVRDEETGEILTITKRSDQILMFVARSRMPKYKDKQQLDVNANVQSTSAISIDTRALTPHQLADLKALALKFKETERI